MDYEFLLVAFIYLLVPPSLAFMIYFFIDKYFPKIIFILKNFLNEISNPKLLFAVLIILTISGFYFHIGYSFQFYSCLGSEDLKIDPLKNFELALVSVGLISIGYFTKNATYGRMLLCIELLLWLFFLFFIKGGYSTVYDSVVIILRFLLLRHLFDSKLKLRLILLITYFVFIAKALLFYNPLISLYTSHFSAESINKNKSLIQGTWIGRVEYSLYRIDTIKAVHQTKNKDKKSLIDIISEMDTISYTYHDTLLTISDPITIKIAVDNIKIFLSKGKTLNYYVDFFWRKDYSENPQIKLIPESPSNIENDAYSINDSTHNLNFKFNQENMLETYGRNIYNSFKFESKDYDLEIILLNEDSLVVYLNDYGIDIKLKRTEGY